MNVSGKKKTIPYIFQNMQYNMRGLYNNILIKFIYCKWNTISLQLAYIEILNNKTKYNLLQQQNSSLWKLQNIQIVII